MYPAPVVAFVAILCFAFDWLVSVLSARFSRHTRFVVYLRDQFNTDIFIPLYCTSYREARAYALDYPDRFVRIDVFSLVASLRKVKVPKSSK